MPITDILEKNCRLYGDDVCLVEINPEMPETKRSTWKEFDLIEPTRAPYYRREITWNVFNERRTVLPICFWNVEFKKETRSEFF